MFPDPQFNDDFNDDFNVINYNDINQAVQQAETLSSQLSNMRLKYIIVLIALFMLITLTLIFLFKLLTLPSFYILIKYYSPKIFFNKDFEGRLEGVFENIALIVIFIFVSIPLIYYLSGLRKDFWYKRRQLTFILDYLNYIPLKRISASELNKSLLEIRISSINNSPLFLFGRKYYVKRRK